MSRVVVHIDGLILRGFHGADTNDMIDGLRQELARAWATQNIALSLTHRNDLSRVRTRDVRIGPRPKPTQVGQAVAQSITRGLRK